MIGKDKELWMLLCEQAANEQDSERLMALIAEIARLVDAKQRRLAGLSNPPLSDEPLGK